MNYLAVPPWIGGRRIIPLVKFWRGKSWMFWEYTHHGVIAADYDTLLGLRSVREEALERGIHDALGYNGYIILVTTGGRPDPKEYVKHVAELRPDAATTHEPCAELGDIEPVGMLRGTAEELIRRGVEELREYGITRVAYYCSRLVERRRLEPIQRFLRICGGCWRWLVGVNSPRMMRRLPADAYSGTKWLWGTIHLLAYSGRTFRRVRRLACHHPVCRRLAEGGVDIRTLIAVHNIEALKEIEFELAKATVLVDGGKS